MPDYALADATLTCAGQAVFTAVGDTLALESDPHGVGVFLRVEAKAPHQRLTATLGQPVAVERFTLTHRYEPFWMIPKAGTAIAEVPAETQWLLARLSDGRCLLVVPLFDTAMRFALKGEADHLAVIGETADAFTVARGGLALFVALGDDPYLLMPRAAAAVAARLGAGILRGDKRPPAFIDVFGWCTWDAFYQDVSHAKVREGLASLAAAGVPPRMLILDDGWQSERTMPTGERRLTGFAANAKFPGDLAPTVAMAKQEFAIETFLVWHAIVGYWGGVDGEALPGYGVRDVPRRYGQGILSHSPSLTDWWGHLAGVVPVEGVGRFYADYHRHLRAQGVDGVKVDNQAMIEGVSDGSGGRVRLNRAYRDALEGSAATHFADTVINCMSNAQETMYGCRSTSLLRTSTDFWPNRPESHGLHLACNAQVSAWFAEFIHPDWDMFQSGHAMGAYHAAGRAVSGAPIYVSDKPGMHDAALLRKLVFSDGSVARCAGIGRPTVDCLYHDCTREGVLLKIFNRNAAGSGVVGVFNARYHAEDIARTPLAGHVAPGDVHGLAGDDFALYAHRSGLLSRVARDGRLSLVVNELAFEVVTVVPIERGIAAIGLIGFFNSGGTISARVWDGDALVLNVRDGGRFLAWCARRPARILVDGVETAAEWDAASGALSVVLAKPGTQELRLVR